MIQFNRIHFPLRSWVIAARIRHTAASLRKLHTTEKLTRMKTTNTNLFIEISERPYKVITGAIKLFKRREDFGYITVEGSSDVRFRSEALRFVIPGVNHPKMSDRIILEDFDIYPDTPVLLTEPEHPYSGNPYTTVVVAKHFYDKALAEIAARPIYRAIHMDARFHGQFTAKNARTSVYIEGTCKEIEAKYPRLAQKDPLALTYETWPIKVRTKWERKNQTGEWLECKDPRSFPSSMAHIQIRVWEWVTHANATTGQSGKREQRFLGHLGNLFERPNDFKGEQFSFEIHLNQGGHDDWVEYFDPRQKRKAEEKPVTETVQPDRKPAEKPATKSVAMPKSGKPRQRVFTDLSQLTVSDLKK